MNKISSFFALALALALPGCVMMPAQEASPPGQACQELRPDLRPACEVAAARTAGQVAAMEAWRQQRFAIQLGELSALPGREFSLAGAIMAKELMDGTVVILSTEGRTITFRNLDQFRRAQNPWRETGGYYYGRSFPHHWR